MAKRTGGQIAMLIIAGVILAFSAFLCVVVTRSQLSFAHEQTCGPNPPVEWRHQVMYVDLVFYAAFAAPTAVLMWRGRTAGLIIAIVLACLALAPPIIGFLFTLFAAGMC